MSNLDSHYPLRSLPNLKIILNVIFASLFMVVPMASNSQAAMAYQNRVDFPKQTEPEQMVSDLLWMGVKDLPTPERPRIILVLGGGGARGLVHIGVLRVLEEEGIPIDEIVGVSVGALIGSLYAGGYSSSDIESMAHEVGWDKLTDFSRFGFMKLVFRDSLFSTRKMENYLERRIGEKNFSDLDIPFSCVATDIRTGSAVVFNEGPVAIAARASATIPGVFEPVQYGQRLLVDGGIVNNLPTNVVPVDSHDIVIGVLPVVNERRFEAKSVLNVLVQSIDVQKRKIEGENSKSADIMIKPFVYDTSMIDLGKSEKLIDWGIQSARKNMPELKALLIHRTREKFKSLSQHGRRN